MSRGFIASLSGLAVTLFAWYGPWAWPAWPAFTAIDLVFGHTGFAEYPFAIRSAIVVLLIVLNVAFWGLVTYGLLSLVWRRPKPAGAETSRPL